MSTVDKYAKVRRIINILAIVGSMVAAIAPVVSAAAEDAVREHPQSGGLVILLALLAKVDWRKILHPGAAVALVLAIPLNSGCAHGPRVVACGEDIAIQNRHLAAQVSSCLLTSDFRACLNAVINGSVAVYDLVSCLVADEAEKMSGEAAGHNARTWLQEQKISVAR